MQQLIRHQSNSKKATTKSKQPTWGKPVWNPRPLTRHQFEAGCHKLQINWYNIQSTLYKSSEFYTNSRHQEPTPDSLVPTPGYSEAITVNQEPSQGNKLCQPHNPNSGNYSQALSHWDNDFKQSATPIKLPNSSQPLINSMGQSTDSRKPGTKLQSTLCQL